MYDFHTPCEDDTEWLKRTLKEAQPESCDYTLGYILGWCSQYNAQIAEIDNCLVMKVENNNLFGFPQGTNREKALETIINNYDSPSFYGIVKSECDLLKEKYPNEYSYYPSRDLFDYVYRTENLATLKGKKYHSKRNHISFFEKNYNWKYEEITADSLGECIKLNEEWFKQNEEKDPFAIDTERRVLNFAFDNYEKLHFRGGLIRVDGKIVAFTFGEKLNDRMFCTHFEKAVSEIRGAYPMINMMFARETISDFLLVNREDDAGSEGLRKSKLSYHPEFLLEKFTAVKL